MALPNAEVIESIIASEYDLLIIPLAELKQHLWNLQLNQWAVEEIPLRLLNIYCKKDMMV